MLRKNEYVVIMTGDFAQLNWVSRFLRISGVAATVKDSCFGDPAKLIVDSSKERKARALSREYVDSCTKQRLIEIKMKEVFALDESKEENVG